LVAVIRSVFTFEKKFLIKGNAFKIISCIQIFPRSYFHYLTLDNTSHSCKTRIVGKTSSRYSDCVVYVYYKI